MPKFKELDTRATLFDQMQSKEDGSIVLMNVFSVAPEDEEALLASWSRDASFMKQQPGYISTQLHKAVGGSSLYVNYAVWENLESFAAAFNHPEFQALIADYPASAVASPHIFKKLAVPGHCVA